MPELKDDSDAVVEEILEEEIFEEEAAEKVETEKEKSKRKRLHSENTYIFDDPQTAITARDLLRYEDGSLVEGFRVFGFLKPENPQEKLKRNDDRCLTDATNFILARNADFAASWLLESFGWKGGLFQTKKKFGAGRSKTVVLATMLEYGKMLACLAFKEVNVENMQFKTLLVTAHADLTVENNEYAKTFKQFFGPGGNYDHYRDDDGTWKVATKEG